MEEINLRKAELTFNGPLEAGIRAVAILGAAFPNQYDIQRLTALDYLLVRTAQLGGPDDLHPATPIKTPATEVRRKVVQDAVLLMMTRNLIERDIDGTGIRYRAGQAASMFLDSLTTPYLQSLKNCASWLVVHFSSYTEAEFDNLMRQFFDTWVIEFQDIERSIAVTT